VLKAGGTPQGAGRHEPHRRAGGNDAVFDAALRRVGAVRVPKIGHLFAAAEALPTADCRAHRLAILSNGSDRVRSRLSDRRQPCRAGQAVRGDTRGARRNASSGWSHANPVDVLGRWRCRSHGRCAAVADR